MDRIAQLADELGAAGYRLRKAQPRGPARLTMELQAPDGTICAGQWHADAAEAARVAALVVGRFGPDAVDVLGGGRLLVQHRGADRRLPILARLVRDGATLVAHRPERRAVVRLDGYGYVKVVRPGSTAQVVEPLRVLRIDDVRLPQVISDDDRRGVVTLSPVAGRTILACAGDGTRPDDDLAADLARVGAAASRLHRHPVHLDRTPHDTTAEVAAARRWLAAATDHRLLPPDTWEPLLDAAIARLPDAPERLSLLHRDLHDKQVVLAPGEPVGLLDLDLATHGDPAVDLANLLAHIDLRVRQGICTERRGARCATALLEGYAPAPDVLARVAPYVTLTRLRLAGVYAFRPGTGDLVAGLLEAARTRTAELPDLRVPVTPTGLLTSP